MVGVELSFVKLSPRVNGTGRDGVYVPGTGGAAVCSGNSAV